MKKDRRKWDFFCCCCLVWFWFYIGNSEVGLRNIQQESKKQRSMSCDMTRRLKRFKIYGFVTVSFKNSVYIFGDIDKLILKSTWKCKGSRNIKRRTTLEDPRSWFLFWQSCCKQDGGVCCSMTQSQGISEKEMKVYIQTPTANRFLIKMPS